MYILKGKIRAYSLYSNQKLLRKGSPHFLPNTEIILSHFYTSQYRFDQKLWVRGIHRSGLLKTKPTRFKYLTELKLEEIVNPSPKTLNFIEANQILIFEDKSQYTLQTAEELLHFFKEKENNTIEPSAITDELFINAQVYLKEIKNLISEKNFETITNSHLKFPLKIKRRKELKAIEIDKKEFTSDYLNTFTERICKSILETEEETIFPTQKRMIIGLTEVEIHRGKEFHIAKLEIE